MMQNIEKNTQKWVVFCVCFGILSFCILIAFSRLSTYDFHLFYQIIASIILAIYAIFLIYITDVVFINNYILRKHIMVMLLSTADVHRCKIIKIGAVMTVSNRIQAIPVNVEIDTKNIVLYLLTIFTPTFHEGDVLVIESKNRYIFSTKGLQNE